MTEGTYNCQSKIYEILSPPPGCLGLQVQKPWCLGHKVFWKDKYENKYKYDQSYWFWYDQMQWSMGHKVFRRYKYDPFVQITAMMIWSAILKLENQAK